MSTSILRCSMLFHCGLLLVLLLLLLLLLRLLLLRLRLLRLLRLRLLLPAASLLLLPHAT